MSVENLIKYLIASGLTEKEALKALGLLEEEYEEDYTI
jgi:hypothetical protein